MWKVINYVMVPVTTKQKKFLIFTPTPCIPSIIPGPPVPVKVPVKALEAQSRNPYLFPWRDCCPHRPFPLVSYHWMALLGSVDVSSQPSPRKNFVASVRNGNETMSWFGGINNSSIILGNVKPLLRGKLRRLVKASNFPVSPKRWKQTAGPKCNFQSLTLTQYTPGKFRNLQFQQQP